MAVHLAIEKFSKATGAYQGGWVVLHDIEVPIPIPRYAPMVILSAQNTLTYDPLTGHLFVGFPANVSEWQTDGQRVTGVNIASTQNHAIEEIGRVGTDTVYVHQRTNGDPSGRNFGTIQRRAWPLGTLLGEWEPPSGYYRYTMKVETCWIDRARWIDGLAIWSVSLKPTTPITQYVVGVADNLPMASAENGQPAVMYAAPKATSSSFYAAVVVSPTTNRFLGFASASVLVEGVRESRPLVHVLRPTGTGLMRTLTLESTWTSLATPDTDDLFLGTDHVHFDETSDHHLYVTDLRRPRVMCFADGGAFVMQTEDWPRAYATINGEVTIYYPYDVATDQDTIYLLLAVVDPPPGKNRIATTDHPFGFRHYLGTNNGNIVHSRSLVGKDISALTSVATGEGMSIEPLPNGSLRATVVQGDTKTVYIGHDLGEVWEQEP